jgi:hypothetical protein
MDITSITSALSSIKTAIDITKILKESSSSLEKAEIKLKLAELIEALAEAKIHFSEIQELVLNKEKQIKELEAALEIKGKLKWENPVYYLFEGNSKGGPFCQQCYDTGKKLIRLQGQNDGFWECKTCKNTFMDERYENRTKTLGSYSDDDDL